MRPMTARQLLGRLAVAVYGDDRANAVTEQALVYIKIDGDRYPVSMAVDPVDDVIEFRLDEDGTTAL